MVLNTFALVFMLGITFVHSMFGLYSGLLNVFCSITSLAVAFGYFEALTDLLTSQGLPAQYVEPGALVLLFAITLIILRTLVDVFLRGNVRVPMYVDWGGGALCGFINAQICVGVMAVGFLMLPWGGRALMFTRYERNPENQADPETGRVQFDRRSLWLHSDSFVIGLFNLLSHGSLRTETAFATVYPDFSDWVFWSGNTVQPESLPAPLRDTQGDGFKTGLKVEKWWKDSGEMMRGITRYRPQAPSTETPKPNYELRDYKPRPGNRLLGMRLALGRASADRDKTSSWHRFRPSMIRLVGDVVLPDGSREPRHYVAQILGGADPSVEGDFRIVEVDSNFAVGSAGDARVDAYFEVDERFEPRFVEYRRHCRVPVTPADLAQTPPTDRLGLVAAGGPAGGGGGRGGGPDKAAGASRFIDTVNRAGSGDRDDLPFPLRRDRLGGNLEVELEGSLLVSGAFASDKATLVAAKLDPKDMVTKLKVPAGRKIFQLQTKPRKAASVLGQAMNFAGSVVNQYQALDEKGDKHPLAGYYAIVKREGQEFIEFFFTPDPTGSGYNGLLNFKTDGIRRALQDQDDALLGLIFLVPPGKDMVGVVSQAGRIEFGETFKIGQ